MTRLPARRNDILAAMLHEARRRRVRRTLGRTGIAAILLIAAGVAITAALGSRPVVPRTTAPSIATRVKEPGPSLIAAPTPATTHGAASESPAIAAAVHPRILISRVTVSDPPFSDSRIKVIRLTDEQLLDDLAALGRDRGLIRTATGTVAVVDNRPPVVIDGRSM